MKLLWPSVLLKLLYHPKDSIYLILQFLFVISLPFLSIISFSVYIVCLILKNSIPTSGYGKFLNYHDVWMEEDFVNSIPRNTIVTTLTIQGDLCLEEFKSIFKVNVLQARSSIKPGKYRYPELRQYVTTFLGFHIWKDDPNFQIDNHILESINYGTTNNNKNTNLDSFLENVHQELLNLPFQKQQSPWNITLIRNLTDCQNNPITLLVLRMHHAMADAKSILKLFVECLGQKKLKTATPKDIQRSWFEKLVFYLLFIPNYLTHIAYLAWNLPQCHFHPWKVPEYWKDCDVKTIVAFSPKLLLSDLKQVSKENGVTSSAVIMAIIAGGIHNAAKNLADMSVTIGYPLPKPNHPEYLTNHVYTGFPKLPTDESNVIKRLKRCNEEFLWVKSTQQAKILCLTSIFGGFQFFPFTRLVVNQFTPVGITNIAGEEEGFKVGKLEVIDFRMSVGVLQGVTGVVFCVLSYKDGIRVAVIGKESVLKRKQAEKLVIGILEELQLLTGA